MLTHELFGLVVLRNARNDDAVLKSVGNFETQQFLHFRHALASGHRAHADIKFLEISKIDRLANGIGFVIGLFVLLANVFEFIELMLNGFVLDFLKQQFGFGQLRTGFQQIDAAQTLPIGGRHGDHFAQTRRREGEERFEGDGKIGHQLEREVENGLYTVGIGLDHLPRFGIGQVFIADTGEVHRLFLCIAKAESFDQSFHFGFHSAEFFDRGAVGLCEFAAGGHTTFVVFLRELKGAVHEVAVNGHQFIVVARLKISPSEIVVLRFRCIGGEHVAQHVLLAGEIHEIFVEPHRPVARSGDFVVLEIEKFVGRHVVGKDI